jgi:hypothetical protein
VGKDTNSQWFGEQWKNQDRAVQRTLTELKAEMDRKDKEADEAAETAQLLQHKRLSVALRVCRAYKQHGPGTKACRALGSSRLACPCPHTSINSAVLQFTSLRQHA